jgi:hypothetical protein
MSLSKKIYLYRDFAAVFYLCCLRVYSITQGRGEGGEITREKVRGAIVV